MAIVRAIEVFGMRSAFFGRGPTMTICGPPSSLENETELDDSELLSELLEVELLPELTLDGDDEL